MAWRKSVAGTVLSLWFGFAYAQAASVQIPDAFLSGIAPSTSAGVERQAALNGSTYTVVAPTYTGSDGNVSYLRLYNANDVAVTFALTIVGTPSARVYGTASSANPPGASPQYALSDILTKAGASGLSGGDTGYAIYMRAPPITMTNGFQHVIYNNANGFFENVSACHYSPTGDYSGLNAKLANVHTSQLSSYPAQIYIHNYSLTDDTYTVTVSDNNTGTAIGSMTLTIPHNSTYTMPFTYFQQQLNWTPSATQQHANMRFTPVSPATFQLEVSNYIYNQHLAAYVNMTQRCGVASSTGNWSRPRSPTAARR
jgi:hypothetical protein